MAAILRRRTAEDTAMDAAKGADEFPQTATLSSQVESMIREMGDVSCGPDCDDVTPVISNIINLTDHWEYTITCMSECGSSIRSGRVDVEWPCTSSAEVFNWCPDTTGQFVPPTPEEIITEGAVTCGDCDIAPVISNIHDTGLLGGSDETPVWSYDFTCTAPRGCTTTGAGEIPFMFLDCMCLAHHNQYP